MKELREFNVDIFKLNNGKYNFEFDINEKFFEFFDYGLIKDGKAKAFVTMDKSETLINMVIKVVGSVELICDRSLENFDFPISTENKILFKFGDHDEEVSDEIIIIDRNTQRLNLAQHIYDFIGLAVPMKKIHPRFQKEENQDSEENILIYSSQEMEDEFKDDKPEETDPRWNVLKNLKLNDN